MHLIIKLSNFPLNLITKILILRIALSFYLFLSSYYVLYCIQINDSISHLSLGNIFSHLEYLTTEKYIQIHEHFQISVSVSYLNSGTEALLHL